jgi:hypothetical protein
MIIGCGEQDHSVFSMKLRSKEKVALSEKQHSNGNQAATNSVQPPTLTTMPHKDLSPNGLYYQQVS